MFGNPLLASAAMDRLLHHAHVLVIEGRLVPEPAAHPEEEAPGYRRRGRALTTTRSVWPNHARHADHAQLAHADDTEVAISFAEPGAISEGEP
jgi:hypothetical protein